MKAKWVNIVDSLQGNVDQRHYARRIPDAKVQQLFDIRKYFEKKQIQQ